MDKLIRIKDVVAALDVSKATAYLLFQRGELRGFRAGMGQGAIRIFEQSVQDYIERKMNQPVEKKPPVPLLVPTRRTRASKRDSSDFNRWMLEQAKKSR